VFLISLTINDSVFKNIAIERKLFRVQPLKTKLISLKVAFTNPGKESLGNIRIQGCPMASSCLHVQTQIIFMLRFPNIRNSDRISFTSININRIISSPHLDNQGPLPTLRAESCINNYLPKESVTLHYCVGSSSCGAGGCTCRCKCAWCCSCRCSCC